jgi:hypothetical protein
LVNLLTGAPLSQANFLPDLMQVKDLFPTVDLIPTLVHLSPALIAAPAGINGRDIEIERTEKKAMNLLFTH